MRCRLSACVWFPKDFYTISLKLVSPSLSDFANRSYNNPDILGGLI